MRNLLFLMMLILTAQAHAVGEHCLVKPDQIEVLTNKMLLLNQREKKIFPDSSVLHFTGITNFSNTENSLGGTIEGIYRPQKNGSFSLTPLPLFVVELNRTRELVYVCAHGSSENPKENYLIVYFLRGYGMGPSTLGSFIGDLLFNSVKVEPVAISPLGLQPIRDLFGGKIAWTPLGLFLIPIEITDTIQRGFMNVFSTFSRVGVERIIMTADQMEFATGVNLKSPSIATYKKVIKFK